MQKTQNHVFVLSKKLYKAGSSIDYYSVLSFKNGIISGNVRNPSKLDSFFLSPFIRLPTIKEDFKIAEEMIEADRLIQIPLKDHVIIGKGWFSFFEVKINS